jgi:uncharacterized protein
LEKERIERKTPFDFIYVYENGKTTSVTNWLKKENKIQENCGLVGLEHFKDCFALYYDDSLSGNLGFKGICLDKSTSINLSSVPKEMNLEAIIYYNKEAYLKHCKEFNNYTVWLENRNVQRYVNIKNHNQQIDGKNLLHCRRLLDTAIEIATKKTIKVKRPNADYLLSLRRGEVDLDTIIYQTEKDLESLNDLFAHSGLPTDCDKDFVNELLLQIRHL